MDTGVCITCNAVADSDNVVIDDETEMCQDCMAEEKKVDNMGMDADDDNG